MKKNLLLFLSLFFMGSLYAADETVTERFSQVDTFAMVKSPTTLEGDLVDWAIRYGRRKDTDTLFANERATWLQGQNDYGYLEMNENFEGGIKNIAFNWGHGNEKDYTVVLRMFVRGANSWGEPVQTWDNTPLDTKAWQEHVSYDLQLKKNSRIKFDNLSVKTESGSQPITTKGRPLIGDITITPYLKYTKKQDTVVLGSGTYQNMALINNTDEGSVTYALVNNNPVVASIDASTGVVTPLAAGIVTVKASWEQVSTTYDLIIAQKETFNSSQQTNFYCSSATSKQADLTTWTYLNAGVKSGLSPISEVSTFEGNAIVSRAPRTGTNDTCYIQSSVMSGGLSQFRFLWNINGEEPNTVWDIRILVNGRLVKTLTNTEITATAIMAEPASITIDSINESGKFILRIENHSTLSSGTITGNSARFTMDDLVLFPYKGAMVLDENQDNSLRIKSNDGEDMNVNLVRKLAEGKYNTFCLPFDISKEDLQTAFGEDVEITSLATLDAQGGSSLSEDKKNLNVVIKEVEAMEAGKPYLLKVSKEVKNPSFKNVTITDVGEENYIQSGDVKFYGINSPFPVPADKTYLFVSNNQLNWNNKGTTSNMKGLRAFFHVPGMEDPSQVSPRLVMRQPNMPTGVVDANINGNGNVKMMMNGQLVIVRNGVYYNVNGQIIK